MAKRAPKSPKPPNSEPTDATPAARPKGRSRGRVKAGPDVASELSGGQDQAAAASNVFVGVPGDGEQPVQGHSSAAAGTPEPGSSTDSVSMSSGPSAEDIRMRAYHRYLERGGGHGMDFEDWLEAERDLRERS